ncbi:MBL fold metallo-hydrolase [Halalkalibacillus halophilus]|uniref:MBL fold metallo-hydrolase n=1 Tax=Halalkalibacillus halophilus TaxID=392827 RepID=UPI0004072B60|nr:MBL fold metallo-hydrolase [Halalkalibacillus halophilus]
MNIYTYPLGLLGTNCYLIEENGAVIIVDPGGEASEVIRFIEERSFQVEAILLTHAHFDHIGGVDQVRGHFNVPVYIHAEEADWLTTPELNGSKKFQVGEVKTSVGADHYIQEGKTSIGQFSFEVLYTPGHSPGSISFFFENNSTLIAGDTLFQGGIGRTDLPFGDHHTLISSIKTKIMNLPEDTQVYPGHGPKTSVQKEVNNPFLV